MTRVLVTGASGAIGSALLPLLDDADVDVHTVDRRPLDRPNHVVVNLEEPDAVRTLVERGPDAIIHLAGSLGSDIDQLFRTNILGTVNLLEAAAPGTRILVAGSAAEYGKGHGEPLNETDPLRPVNPYGWSKVAQTKVAAAIAERRSLRLTIVRPFNVVSANQPPSTALGNMVRQLEAHQEEASARVVTGRLDIVRDYVPITFVAQVLSAVALDPESEGTFNICSGVGINLGDILDAMGRLRGVEVIPEPDPKLVAMPSASIVTGDPSLLTDRFGLSIEPTPDSIAALVLGLNDPPSGPAPTQA